MDAGPKEANLEVSEAQDFLVRLSARRPVVTWILLGAIVVVFGLEQLWGGGSVKILERMGAEVPSRIRAGEYYRLLAPVFLHSGLPHIVMNGAVLWMLGSVTERLLGSARFVILYVVSGLLGSTVSAYFANAAESLSVGASGALFGLFSATAVLGLWPRGQIPPLIARDLKRTALINLGLNVFVSMWPRVDYLAHLGGAIAGVVLVGSGLLRPTVLRPPPASPSSARLREGFLRGLAMLCAVALIGSLIMAFWIGRPWTESSSLSIGGADGQESYTR